MYPGCTVCVYSLRISSTTKSKNPSVLLDISPGPRVLVCPCLPPDTREFLASGLRVSRIWPPRSVSNLLETFETPSAVFFFWSFFVQRAKMSRIDAERLDAMSKKELVDLIQSVAPLDMLQSNSLGGNPANVAKKANKERIVDCRSRASDALTSTH